jgi:hypothetical protein
MIGRHGCRSCAVLEFWILDEEKDNGPRLATTATGPLSPAAFFILPINYVNTMMRALELEDPLSSEAPRSLRDDTVERRFVVRGL